MLAFYTLLLMCSDHCMSSQFHRIPRGKHVTPGSVHLALMMAEAWHVIGDGDGSHGGKVVLGLTISVNGGTEVGEDSPFFDLRWEIRQVAGPYPE